MRLKRQKSILSALCCIADILFVCIAIARFFRYNTQGALNVGGAECFRYFTIDANVFAAIVSALLLPLYLRALKSGKKTLPRWAMLLKFSAALMLALTFTVVVLYLGPVQGFDKMATGSNFFLHILCPPLVVLPFFFLDTDCGLRKSDALPAVLPILCYALLYLTMVVILGASNGGWPDFYNFNDGGLWPVFFTVLVGGSYGAARLMIGLKNKADKRTASGTGL